jgi:outer membrane protein assembly factor BamE (lipoprotein component of BamABCDE complex)
MQTNFFFLTKLSFITATCFALLSVLPSCTPRIESRGNLPNSDMLSNIEVGQVNKREVVQFIGSPSTIELFKGESWYYISEKTATNAFFEPKISSRKIVIIRFNKKGIVKEIKTIGLKESQNVKMVDRVTPTAGQEMTILQQLFGNIGRYGGSGGGTMLPGTMGK